MKMRGLCIIAFSNDVDRRQALKPTRPQTRPQATGSGRWWEKRGPVRAGEEQTIRKMPLECGHKTVVMWTDSICIIEPSRTLGTNG